jgi:DNA replication protein DnaD
MSSYIKLSSQIANWQWRSDHKMLSVWIALLTSAAYKPMRLGKYNLLAGQYRTSRARLAREAHVSEQELRTVLSKLLGSGEITIETDSQGMTVTICKWHEYQGTTAPTVAPATESIAAAPAAEEAPETNQVATSPQPSPDKPELRAFSPPEKLSTAPQTGTSNQHNRKENNIISLSPDTLHRETTTLVLLWKNQTGQWLSKSQARMLMRCIEDFGKDRVQEAIEDAAERGLHPFAYFCGTMTNLRHGIDYSPSGGLFNAL